MANFFRLLLGGVIAFGVILVTLAAGALVLVGTLFGLVASRFRRGGPGQARTRGAADARRRAAAAGVGGTGDVIDVEVTTVTPPPRPAARLHE